MKGEKSGCIWQPTQLHRTNVINSLYALICDISDTDFIDNEIRFDISRLAVFKFFTSFDKFEYNKIKLYML